MGGSWEGKGEQERKKLLFGAEQQGQGQSLEEEVEEVLAELRREEEAEEKLREEREEQQREERQREEQERQRRESKERVTVMRRRGEECLREVDVVPCTSASGKPAMEVGWTCPCVVCGDERGWLEVCVMKEGRQEAEQECYHTPPCGTRVRIRCWEKKLEEGVGGGGWGWDMRVVPEEKREVQPFGCASTSC